MPEGPEARTVSDKLKQVLVSKLITSFYKGERAKTLGFNNLICPVKVVDVRSYGKKILIELDSGHMIIISLGMEGRIRYVPGNHSHIRFDISESSTQGIITLLTPVFSLYFDDSRYMGGIDIIPISGFDLYFKNMGPDLLQAAIDEKTWIPQNIWLKIFTNKKLQNWTICKALMDQSLVSGIGNYLKCEILYYSGIHPDRLLKDISLIEWETLRINSHKVIKLAYYYRGFTIKSFISPDGEWGTYPAAVYGKTHDPLGNPVITITTKDGRTSHIVPSLQK